MTSLIERKRRVFRARENLLYLYISTRNQHKRIILRVQTAPKKLRAECNAGNRRRDRREKVKPALHAPIYILHRARLCRKEFVRGAYEICSRSRTCACTGDTRQVVQRVWVDSGGSGKLTGIDEATGLQHVIHALSTCQRSLPLRIYLVQRLLRPPSQPSYLRARPRNYAYWLITA